MNLNLFMTRTNLEDTGRVRVRVRVGLELELVLELELEVEVQYTGAGWEGSLMHIGPGGTFGAER